LARDGAHAQKIALKKCSKNFLKDTGKNKDSKKMRNVRENLNRIGAEPKKVRRCWMTKLGALQSPRAPI
jgi:coenzyme F420-reducing hydrogenase delta subunit